MDEEACNRDGIIDRSESAQLNALGFSPKFVDGLAKRALQKRVQRLSSQMNPPFNTNHRIDSIVRLGVLGKTNGSTKIVSALIKGLKDRVYPVRYAASKALLNMREKAVPGIIDAINNGENNPTVLSTLAGTLGSFGAEAKQAAPQLVMLLSNADPAVRERAAEALGKIGSDAITSLPKLMTASYDDDPNVVCSASLAIVRVSSKFDKSSVEKLVDLLEHPDPKICCDAARALGSIGPRAKAAIESLKNMEQDSTDYSNRPFNTHKRYWANWAIERINTPPKSSKKVASAK